MPSKTYTIHEITLRLNYLFLEYNPLLKERSRALRKARNLPEVLFWMQVHKGHFHGLDFDRQKIIGNYIVDFYVKALGLVIEIDGGAHQGCEEEDAERQAYLVKQGCRVLRFSTTLVLYHMDQVLQEMEEFILQNYT